MNLLQGFRMYFSCAITWCVFCMKRRSLLLLFCCNLIRLLSRTRLAHVGLLSTNTACLQMLSILHSYEYIRTGLRLLASRNRLSPSLPHAAAREPWDGFPWNFVMVSSTGLCRHMIFFFKVGQGPTLYTKIYTSSCRRVKSDSPIIDQSEGLFEQTLKRNTSRIYILHLHRIERGMVREYWIRRCLERHGRCVNEAILLGDGVKPR
jgi:hypothetical protein